MKLETRILIPFQNIFRVKGVSRTPKCYFTWKHLELMWKSADHKNGG